MKFRGLSLAAGVLLATSITTSAVAGAPPFTTVWSGLNNPRGLAFGANGRLYVAEAGLGTGTSEDGLGFTGAIDEIRNPASAHPSFRTVVSGLASLGSTQSEVVGLDGISVQGNNIFGIMAESVEAAGNSTLGKLLRVTPDGTTKEIANVGSVNYAWTASVVGNPAYDPGHQYPDSNPYGVLALPGRQYVVDAGANTLNVVRSDGSVKILAFLPNINFSIPIPNPPELVTDATPTCLAQGPDGALYIGTLALVPSFFGGPVAKVYRVDVNALEASGDVPVLGAEDEWATGFWPIHGMAFGSDGSLYVAELFTHVDIVQGRPVPSGGDVKKTSFAHPELRTSLTDNQLTFPAGVAVGPDGGVYVANGSTFQPVGAGAVVRLQNQ